MTMSVSYARRLAVDELTETLQYGGLDEVCGVQESKETDPKGKTYYNLLFCKARLIDGAIKVYSDRYIVVKWITQFRDIAPNGQEVFKTVYEAKRFIQEKFVR
jgi:hypothetical protein